MSEKKKKQPLKKEEHFPQNKEEAFSWEQECGFPLLAFPLDMFRGHLVQILPSQSEAVKKAEELLVSHPDRKYVVYQPTRILQTHSQDLP